MKHCETDVVKNALDKWLSTISGEPQIPGYTVNQYAESKSIHHITTSKQKEKSANYFISDGCCSTG